MDFQGQSERKRVCAPEQTLRYERSAYDCTRKVGAMRQAGWHRRNVNSCPSVMLGTGFLFWLQKSLLLEEKALGKEILLWKRRYLIKYT